MRTLRSVWSSLLRSFTGWSSRFTFQPRMATNGAICSSLPASLPTRVAPFTVPNQTSPLPVAATALGSTSMPVKPARSVKAMNPPFFGRHLFRPLFVPIQTWPWASVARALMVLLSRPSWSVKRWTSLRPSRTDALAFGPHPDPPCFVLGEAGGRERPAQVERVHHAVVDHRYTPTVLPTQMAPSRSRNSPLTWSEARPSFTV